MDDNVLFFAAFSFPVTCTFVSLIVLMVCSLVIFEGFKLNYG